MKYRHRYDAEPVEWNYVRNKLKSLKAQPVLSADGSYIVNDKGKRLARNITRNSHNRQIELFWYGWVHQLERVQSLYHRLIARKNKHFADVIEPFMRKLLGNKKSVCVWFDSVREDETVMRRYTVSKEEYSYSLTQRLPKKSQQPKDMLTWSYGTIPDHAQRLPYWQLPAPTSEGKHLESLLQYNNDLNHRIATARAYLFQCINLRIKNLADNYSSEDLIRFKIDHTEYTFQRHSDHHSWTFVGDVSHEVDIQAAIPEPPPNEMWQYELYRR